MAMAASIGGSTEKSRRAAIHHGSEHADGILLKTLRRLANASNDPCVEVPQSARVIDDRKRADVVEECIDSEIAPEGILLGRAKRIVPMDDAIVGTAWRPGPLYVFLRRLGGERDLLLRGNQSPEGRDLKHLRAETDVREPEPATNDPAISKKFLDLVRMGRGADVKVLRPMAQQ